jgi:hypothetical protein
VARAEPAAARGGGGGDEDASGSAFATVRGDRDGERGRVALPRDR